MAVGLTVNVVRGDHGLIVTRDEDCFVLRSLETPDGFFVLLYQSMSVLSDESIFNGVPRPLNGCTVLKDD